MSLAAWDRLTAAKLRQAPTLSRAFFNRDPATVGRELLGKLLIRREGRQLLAGRIVEDEAYLGKDDPAAHSYAGRTPRNSVLFGPPGHAYVYFIYGNHYCLNVSCMPEGVGEGVLFRAMEPVFGLEAMARAREIHCLRRLARRNCARSPAAPDAWRKRSASLACAITTKTSPRAIPTLWFADDGFRPERIVATPRIGITKAVERPLRFVIAGNPFVSGKKMG